MGLKSLLISVPFSDPLNNSLQNGFCLFNTNLNYLTV